jgi:hypothetical protein
LQEDLQNRSIVLTTKAAKLSGKALAALMRAALRKMRKAREAPKEGKQTVKQLSRGGSLQNIEISEDNIKAFEPYARKFGVSYALQKDVSEDPPKWLVFFRAKDTDALTGAFKAFSADIVKRGKDERPSARDTMHKFREVIKNAVRDKTKHKHREGPEL